MKSTVVFAIALMASVTSFAAPTAGQVNQKAYEILVANASQLHVEGEGSGYLSTLLAKEFAPSPRTTVSAKNACKFDGGDSVFNCELVILNRDNSGETESATIIRYQLEKDSSGLPSSNMPYMSVDVSIAG
jgi:hypothetical protein